MNDMAMFLIELGIVSLWAILVWLIRIHHEIKDIRIYQENKDIKKQ
jgi:hypothetical protein